MNYYALLIHLTKLYPGRKEQKTKVEKLLMITADEPLTDGLVEQEVKQQFGHGFTHNVLTVSQISQQEYQA
ncbi:hypothetical protein KZX29_04400 [Moraxella osloensis]|uniref:hypothetical protein n=1 Tax=Faucicola osloensis TaxID=34062 RepID=UPI002005D37A|nr:hypothetical protein [Moraxella osloensis]MCK6158038.1 hypothetical protein [Moraxella osloensis]